MNSTVSTVIIEDDIEAMNYLAEILNQQFDQVKIVGHSDTVSEGIQLLDKLNPELVFMDIKLRDGNAFEILDTIKNYDFEIIFITAHDEYLKQAIDYYAFNFVSKPIEVEKLFLILDRYFSLKDRLFTKQKYTYLKNFFDKSKLLIQCGDSHISLDIQHIIQINADGNYSQFILSNGNTHLATKSLKHYENLLGHIFFRANRSILINIKHITSIYKKESITLSNNTKVIVSTRNKTKVSELIQHLSSSF